MHMEATSSTWMCIACALETGFYVTRSAEIVYYSERFNKNYMSLLYLLAPRVSLMEHYYIWTLLCFAAEHQIERLFSQDTL